MPVRRCYRGGERGFGGRTQESWELQRGRMESGKDGMREQETETQLGDEMKRQIQIPVAAVLRDVEAIMWSTDTERAVTVAPARPSRPPPPRHRLSLLLCFIPFCP